MMTLAALKTLTFDNTDNNICTHILHVKHIDKVAITAIRTAVVVVSIFTRYFHCIYSSINI